MTGKATIAVVDDEPAVRSCLKLSLEAEGLKVRTYDNGATALEALLNDPVDLAILARDMPRMHGPDMLRQLRRHVDTPAILLTSYDAGDIYEMYGEDIGFDDILPKPFSPRLVVERVKAILRRVERDDAPALAGEPARLLERGTLILDTRRSASRRGTLPVTLTVTEFLLLEALATHPAVGGRRAQAIAGALDDSDVGARTIDDLVMHLRGRFKEIVDGSGAIEIAYSVVYRQREV
jgi:two-component system response regulator ChvI